MIIEMKRWIYDKISEDAKRYNTFIDVEHVNGYYADTEKDTVKAIGEILKETEKAIQVKFSTGSVVGSYKGWTAWLPKSQLI